MAAHIYAGAYRRDPGLYTTLRSLDSLDQVLGHNTSLILRTDAAPFRMLTEGPIGTGEARGNRHP